MRELAGLPGLLSRVDPRRPGARAGRGAGARDLLPSLVREVSRSRRRRVYGMAGLAAAAAVAIGLVVVQGVAGDDNPPAASPPAPRARARPPRSGQAMSPVGDAPVTASVAFTPVTWGTKLDLTCSYEPTPGEYQLPRRVTYGLFVVNRDGSAEQVGTWQRARRPDHAAGGARRPPAEPTSPQWRCAPPTDDPSCKLVA